MYSLQETKEGAHKGLQIMQRHSVSHFISSILGCQTWDSDILKTIHKTILKIWQVLSYVMCFVCFGAMTLQSDSLHLSLDTLTPSYSLSQQSYSQSHCQHFWLELSHLTLISSRDFFLFCIMSESASGNIMQMYPRCLSTCFCLSLQHFTAGCTTL